MNRVLEAVRKYGFCKINSLFTEQEIDVIKKEQVTFYDRTPRLCSG